MHAQQRRALLVLAICSFGLGTGEYAALGLLPGIATDLHVSVASAGHLISAYALGVVIGAPLLTAASVRLPRKGLIIGLVLALAVGNILSALAPGFGSLLVVRFLSGLPHGAFFGLASVQAATMVSAEQRSRAMAMVFAGLTIANVVGVPVTTYVSQHAGWRPGFVLVAAIELIGAGGVLAAVPRSPQIPAGSPDAPHLRREMWAFRNPQIWLALAVAMIGCGAIFSTFSYIAPMMTGVAGFAQSSITPLLVLFGLGMTFGNLVGAHLADRYDVGRVIYGVMAGQVIVAGAFYFAANNRIASAVMVFVFPFCNTMAFPALQNRIIGLAGGAPNLAAGAMHAAFNIANSMGAWLGGLTIAAGWGYNSPNLVAVGLGSVAAVIALIAALVQGPPVRVFRPTSGWDDVPPPTNRPTRFPVVGMNTNPIPIVGHYSNSGRTSPDTNPIPVIRTPAYDPGPRR